MSIPSINLPAYKIKIDEEFLPTGVKVEAGSLKINYDKTGTRATLSFVIIDENFTDDTNDLYYFESVSGKRVKVYENRNGLYILIFGGKIYEPETRKLNVKPQTKQTISCVDNHECCDRRLVNESYPKMYIHDLFKAIVDEYLADEGIWYDSNSIQETTSEISVNCPYIYVSKVFDEIAELIGWQWYIKANKQIFFNDGSYEIGPTLNENAGYLFDSFKIKDDMSEYRNKEVLRKVNAVTDELTEIANPLPDNNRSYYVRFKLNNKPKIYITIEKYKNKPRESDLVDPRYVGINGLDTGMEWYWSKNENTITQDQDQPELTSGQYVVLKYKGQYEIDIVRSDTDEIAARKEIEGGDGNSTGIYEEAINGDGIEGILVGETKAQADLNRYASVAKKIIVSSYNHKFENGQLCRVIFPTFDIDAYYLVNNLKIVDKNIILRRDVELIDGEAIGGWINFFKKWMAKEDDFVLREDALVETTMEVEEEQEWSGDIDLTLIDCLYPEDDPGGLYPANNLYPGTVNVTRNYSD
jgi:hypothetical protein